MKKKSHILLNSKFIAVFFIITLLVPLLALAVFSHSGRTDSAGGHYDRSTGKYHYHHGHPAHSHPNGVCPYKRNNVTTSTASFTENDNDRDSYYSSSGKYTTEAQYALMTANRNSTKAKTTENNTTKYETTENNSTTSQNKESLELEKSRRLVAIVLVGAILFVAFILSMIAMCGSKEHNASQTNFSFPRVQPPKEEPFILSTKFTVIFFLSSVVISLIIWGIVAYEEHEFSLESTAKFTWIALLCTIVTIAVLSILLLRRTKKSREVLDNYEFCKRELAEKKIKIESLKEDVRLAKRDCENYAAKCTLSKLRTEYLFVTKHLCNRDYEQFYLDSLADLKHLTVSPFDTMNQVAPMVADYLLCSIKQAEEEMSKSKSDYERTKSAKIGDIRKETKTLLSKYIQNQYKLEYLLRTFPELNYFLVADTSYRSSELYLQTKENIAEALPNLREPTKARWNVFFNICMHRLFEFGSPLVYEIIFQKLTSEISQMIKDDSDYIWDLNMQISSLSLLFGISSELLKTAAFFLDSSQNEIKTALKNFSEKCLSAQLKQGGITNEIYASLLDELNENGEEGHI